MISPSGITDRCSTLPFPTTTLNASCSGWYSRAIAHKAPSGAQLKRPAFEDLMRRNAMQRTLVPKGKFRSQELFPGVFHEGTSAVFFGRSNINERNAGRQTLPCDNVRGIAKTRLTPDAQWDLGERDDPDRGIVKGTFLGPHRRLAARRYEDWHAIVVLEGTLQL